MFIDLGNTTVNTDHIVKIEDGHHGYLYHLTDGSVVHCNVSDYAFLEKVGAAYLPASPGFERLECSHDGDDVFASPVLAWRIDGFGTGMPVCAEMNVGGDMAIKYPDGRVYDWEEDMTFDTAEEWGALCKAKKARKLKPTA